MNEKNFFRRLCIACREEWRAYCDHEFVRRLGDGSLPEECFRHYLIQDYLFLIHFSRAWGLAVYKSDNLDDMRDAAVILDAHLNQEIELHVKYCNSWGINRKRIEETPEATATMAYTRYVLERGSAGDVLDLHVALAPCVIGYAVIGTNLAGKGAKALEANPYREWIDMYAGDEYQAVAATAVKRLDNLAASRMGPGRLPELIRTFSQATVLEIAFWRMGLEMQE
ncbi:MAG TPA: thiaminase II [Desulfobacteraceae bacterium]|nr:thiaminase II [Desulfobacteraceae bacterium]